MIEIAVGITLLLLALLVLGIPVAVALLISGALGLWLVDGYFALAGIMRTGPYEAVASYTLSTLPMFILMAEFLSVGNITRDIFSAANKWLGHRRGGLAYAALAGGSFLAAVVGSSSAAAASLANSAFPEMRRHGYKQSFAAGAVAVIGTLGLMIPPSIAFVLFGVLTETSIGKLFLAAILPGILTAIGYVFAIKFIVKIDPDAAPLAMEKAPYRERLRSLMTVWPAVLLFGMVLFMIYGGFATPTEVGALAALTAFLIVLFTGRMTWKKFLEAIANTTRHSSMILIIVAMAGVFGVFLTLTGVTQDLVRYINSLDIERIWILLSVVFILLILGFFMDQLAILILTAPVTMPVLVGLGYDPIWIGVIYVKAAEIGMVTPPLGLNSYVVSAVTKVPVTEVFKGIWLFLVIDLIVLAALIAFPQIALFIPNL